jgi:hypothetical protein
MTKATDHTPPDAPRALEHDDLTQIKGIGEVTQQWLRETFAVRTYRDLARVPSTAIEERLKAGGKITARSKIHEWLVQARQLADRAGAPDPAPEAVKPDEWKTFSTFVVMFEERQIGKSTQFQTKAHHMEADKTEAWPGIVQDDLIQWITAQLGPRALEGMVAAAPGPATAQDVQQAPFSEKLSQYVAKAYHLAGEPASPHLRASRPSPAPQPGSAGLEMTAAPYSGKLRQIITKARHLAGDE